MKISGFLLLMFFLACSDHNETLSPSEESERMALSYDSGAEAIIQETADNSVSSRPETVAQKIIKTATLVFESTDPEKTHEQILSGVRRFNGIVQNDNSGTSSGRMHRNLVVRIPSEQFSSFISSISDGIPYFDRREINQQDVTEEFVDLEARLKAKRELEKRYLELLKEARNVKEMLEIERELSKIREEIEARQGRLEYLQDRVSMSTVYIEFYKTTSNSGITQSYGHKMKNALKGGWNGISAFFLGLLYIWPLLIFILVFLWGLRWYLKKRNKTH